MAANSDADLREFEENFQEFWLDTKGEDSLQVIIRGHLYIESQIDKLLRLAIPKPQFLTDRQFNFYSKLKLCFALDLIPEDFELAFTKFNKIRNKFAHNLKYKLSENDFTDVYGVLNSHLREMYNVTSNYPDLEGDELLLARFRAVIAIFWVELRLLCDTYEIVQRVKETEFDIEKLRDHLNRLEYRYKDLQVDYYDDEDEDDNDGKEVEK